MSAPTDFTWKPPRSPDAREYREAEAYIEALMKREPKKGMAWFRAIAESDFWFWQAKVMSLGRLEIRDPGHKRIGRLWVNEPWFFDRMREVQEDFDRGRSNVLYQFSRGLFKSSAIQKGGILWFTAKDRTCTSAVITHKADKVGDAFMGDYQKEIEQNEVLKAHWPQYRRLLLNSAKAITVDRPPGIREPTISVHGSRTSLASGHYRIIIVDDPADPEERSPIVLEEIDHRLNLLTFVGHDDTQTFWIGCPSQAKDPIELRKKRGYFSIIRKHPGVLPGGVYPMRSRAWYEAQRKETTEDLFSSQVLLEILPPGRRFFREEWLTYYGQASMPSPDGRAVLGYGEEQRQAAAAGCRIHIIVDPAEGRKESERKKKSDFLVIRVLAFTHDKLRLNLDLWRERVGITDACDLLFGLPPGEEAISDNAWKVQNGLGLRRGLVGKWKRFDRRLTVWVEEVGASQFVGRLQSEMAHRNRHNQTSPTCSIRELRSNVQKEQRISTLQPDYRNGVIQYPRAGFGHGSFTDDDERDTMLQFIEDEYRLWTLSGDILHDDMLDTEAWPRQASGASMSYPDLYSDSVSPETASLLTLESSLAAGGGWTPGPPAGSWKVS